MAGDINTDALRKRLLWRIQRRYVTTTSAVRIGPLAFEFTRIADPDRVLDEVAEEADRREKVTGRREKDEHLHLPYWAELWDSAMGMGQVLVKADKETRRQGDKERNTGMVNRPASLSSCLPVSLSSASVLDLGCGMGLSGTVAAALGAKVMFADIEPPALLFARLNSLPWRRRVRARRVNWKTDRLGEKFDVILGADIIYERGQWEYLEPFWREHLKEGGVVMLGEPGRQTGDLFIAWVKGRGWTLEIIEEKVATRERPIRVMVLTIEPVNTQ